MRQTAGAWAWREQAGTRQRDATGSAEWLLFWDRLVEDVINLNAGQGWVAPFGDLQQSGLCQDSKSTSWVEVCLSGVGVSAGL